MGSRRRGTRRPARMVTTRPKVATASASHWPVPVRAVCDTSKSGSSNIACASSDPAMPPATCAARRQRGARRDLAAQRKDQRHGRIEMRAGDRPEDRDQHDEDRAGRQRVAEQCQRCVVGQPVGHDAGADDRRDQQRGAERLGGEASGQVVDHAVSAGLAACRRRSRRAASAAPAGRASSSADW